MHQTAKEYGDAFRIEAYVAEERSDVTRLVHDLMEEDIPTRFYACGGDGTLGELINSVAEFPATEVGMVPLGTGNDFPRNFTNKGNFLHLRSQLEGTAIPLDLLSITDRTTGFHRFAINMLNIGFDCEVAKLANHGVGPFRGSLAYLSGVLVQLFRPLGVELSFTMDGGKNTSGSFLLVSVANGGYCGGGFFAAPYSNLEDGLMEVGVVLPVSRLKILQLIGQYRKGTHLTSKQGKQIVRHSQERELMIRGNGATSACIDGEIYPFKELCISILPHAVSFNIPQGCAVKERKPLPPRVPSSTDPFSGT